MQKFLSLLSPFTKVTALIGLILIIYSFLCREMGIYFFWESDYVGMFIFFIAAISFLSGLIKRKKQQSKKTALEKVIIGFIVFVMALMTFVIILFNNSDALAAAKKQLSQNQQIKSQVGNVTGFGLFLSGSMQVSSSNGKSAGGAALSLTVKGDQRFKDFTVIMLKDPEKEDWEIESIE